MGNKNTTYYKRFESRIVRFDGIVTTYPSIVMLTNGRTAADDPHWKSKVKRGTSATNDLSAVSNSQTYSPGEAAAKAISGPYVGQVCYTNTGIPKPVAPGVVDANKLLNANTTAAVQIRKKIQKETQSFSGLTFLGELRESVRMIRHPAEALAGKLNRHISVLAKRKKPSYFYSARKGAILQRKPRTRQERNQARDYSKMVADSWLEGVFGWAPLLNDISDIAEASLNRFNDPVVKRISAIGKETATLSQVLQRTAGYASIYCTYSHESRSERKVIYTVGYKRELDRSNNGLERVVQSSGLGTWNDIMPAAWELVPWSFLVDYFSNIGDVINAACVSMSNVAWGQQTTIDEHIRTYKGIGHVFLSATYVRHLDTAGCSVAKKRTVSRVTALPPIPGVRFELPESNLKLANIAALLAGRLKNP